MCKTFKQRRSLKTLLLLLTSCVFLMGSMVHASQATVAITNNDTSTMEKTILSHVNQYRRAHGLKPLRMQAQISHEAYIHSLDMATHRISFGHQYFPDRFKRLCKHIKLCRGGAENVAFNYKDPRFLVQEWIKSRGHKKNIVGNYNLTGIGIATDKNGRKYYTQIFIRSDAE